MAFDHSTFGKLLEQLSELGRVRRDSVTHKGRENAQREIVTLLGQMQHWVEVQPIEKGLTRRERNRNTSLDSGETQA